MIILPSPLIFPFIQAAMEGNERNKYFILYWLGETNILIALASASAAAGVFAMFEKVPEWHLIIFIFSATLFTYNMQRWLGDFMHTNNFMPAKRIMMIAAIFGMLITVWHITPVELIVLGFSGALSFAYAHPFMMLGGVRKSLRQIPYLKIWIITLAWVLGVVLAPMLGFFEWTGWSDTFQSILFLIQQGSFVLALTIPFDVRDLKTDDSSFKTIPMIWGNSRAVFFGGQLLLLSSVCSFLNFLTGLFYFESLLMHLAVCIGSWLLVRKGKRERSPVYYSVGLDGMLFLQGLLLVTAFAFIH